MRQKQQEAVGTQPLGLAGGDELIDHDLRAVGEIAELGFPKHQRFGIGERIAVFETEHAIFGERRIEHLETAMLDVIERYMFVLVGLIDPHRVALREGAAPRILARSEEHTSELQSLMRISYAVFCLKKKPNTNFNLRHTQ